MSRCDGSDDGDEGGARVFRGTNVTGDSAGAGCCLIGWDKWFYSIG